MTKAVLGVEDLLRLMSARRRRRRHGLISGDHALSHDATQVCREILHTVIEHKGEGRHAAQRRAAHLSDRGHSACRWMYHMAAVTPDLRLSSQPHSTAIDCWPALISHPAEGRRLSWPKWLVAYRDVE